MCFYCKGDMKQGKTVFTVQYENRLVVIKNVPCQECEQCGKIEISDDVMKKIESMVDIVKKMMQEIAVINYEKLHSRKKKRVCNRLFFDKFDNIVGFTLKNLT